MVTRTDDDELLDEDLAQRVMREQAEWTARLECERWRTSTPDPAAAINELKLRESPAYAKPYRQPPTYAPTSPARRTA